MTTVRAKIDIASGLFELEGDKDFVSDHLDKLMPLISRFPVPKLGELKGPPKGDNAEENDEGEPVDSAKKKKRMPKRPAGGASCRERIVILRDKGFFSTKRGASDVKQGLETEGWTYQNNQIGAALTQMFGGGEIRRTKEGGSFKYFWDRS
jgi:hypothetical protein